MLLPLFKQFVVSTQRGLLLTLMVVLLKRISAVVREGTLDLQLMLFFALLQFNLTNHPTITRIYIIQMNNKFSNLIKTIKKGDLQKVSTILQQSTLNINQYDPKSGKGLLQLAMENDEVDIFKMLIGYPGINPELMSKEGELPLEIAVRLNSLIFVSHLLEKGASPRKRNDLGENALYVAFMNTTSKEILKKLITHNFNINEKIIPYGNYLNLTIESLQPDNFNFLLAQEQINFTICDEDENTCLMNAIKHNRGDIFMMIMQKLEQDKHLTQMEKQFFVNSQNSEGNTALHIASMLGLQTVGDKLKKMGAKFGLDFTIKNKKGLTALEILEERQKERERELQMEHKKSEQKIIRKQEKKEEKMRQKQQEEMQVQQEKRLRKKQQQEEILQSQAYSEVKQKRTIWIFGIIVLVAIGVVYLAFVNTIEKKRLNSL